MELSFFTSRQVYLFLFEDGHLAADLVALTVCDDVEIDAAGHSVAAVVLEIPRYTRAVSMKLFHLSARHRKDFDGRSNGQSIKDDGGMRAMSVGSPRIGINLYC